MNPAGTSAPAIELSGLHKSFGPAKIINGVDLSVPVGERHAIIGPNGAGKSTLFHLISGRFAPTSGTIKLDGRDITGWRPAAINKAGLARSFQVTNIFPKLSVWENVRCAVLRAMGHGPSFWRGVEGLPGVAERTEEILSRIRLGHRASVAAGLLAYADQRALEIGIAIASDAKVILLDEPMAGMSHSESEHATQLIREVTTGRTLLMVEHDIDRVFQIADAVTVMNEGTVLVDGTVEDARTSPRVQEVYIGSGTAAMAARPRPSAAETQVLLSLENVDTFYGKSHILSGVTFDVHAHEIVALLGRNGAGKSTCLKTTTGLAPHAAGHIRLGDEVLDGRSAASIARAGIGYVPQGRGLFAGMSVAENLELGRLKRRTGNGVHWDEERVLSYFPRLRERWRTPADYLSGGEQQMVAVARALSGDVRVLLLDEPFEGLAPAVVESLFETFDALRREVSIVIVDHNLDLALALSDRTVALERGRVMHTGPSQALRDDLALRRQVLWL